MPIAKKQFELKVLLKGTAISTAPASLLAANLAVDVEEVVVNGVEQAGADLDPALVTALEAAVKDLLVDLKAIP